MMVPVEHWTSQHCIDAHQVMLAKLWYKLCSLFFVGIVALAGVVGWVYAETSGSNRAAAEAREKALMAEQANDFLKEQAQLTNSRLLSIEKSLSRLEGRLGDQARNP